MSVRLCCCQLMLLYCLLLWCGDVKLGCCEDWATLGRERDEEERSHCSDRERREMSA